MLFEIASLFVIACRAVLSASKDFTRGMEILRGKHCFIGAVKFAPYGSYSNVSVNGKIYDLKGFSNDLLFHLARKYGFNFEYVQPHDEVFGALVNGSWNGLVGMLYRNEVDLVATLTVTYPRSKVIDYTVQFSEDPVSLLIPHPVKDSTAINGVLRPFHSQVWFLIGISIIAVTIFLWAILTAKSCMFEGKERNTTLSNSLWSLLHLQKIVEPKVFTRPSKTPVYLVLCSWCLAVIVLANAYSTTLMSYVMAPRFIPMIDSIEDIVNISRPTFMVLKYTSYDSALLNAAKENSMVLSKIGDSLREHPELRLTQTDVEERIADLITDYQRSYTMVQSDLLIIMERDFKQTGQCRLYIAKKPWDTSRVALALPKSSPLTQIFSIEINRLRDAGILDYWHRRNWPRRNRCSEPLTTQINKSHSKLTLNYFLSNFVLLGCGALASLLGFIIEIMANIYYAK